MGRSLAVARDDNTSSSDTRAFRVCFCERTACVSALPTRFDYFIIKLLILSSRATARDLPIILTNYQSLSYAVDIVEDSAKFQTKLIIDTVPRMIFNNYNFDFGHLVRGKKVYHTFYFTNMGAQDLFVEKVSSSNACKVVVSPEEIIPPGESGRLVVQVKTVGNIGVQHRTISIQTNDPVNPVIILGVHGTVRQPPPTKQNQGFCYE